MRRAVGVILISTLFLLPVAACNKRIEVQQPDGAVIVNDRYRDVLDSDLPAEAKERALKDLLSEEARNQKSGLDWILQILTLGASVFAGVKAAT
jgi:hypothetical protein